MRRLLADEIHPGEIELDDAQSHHARSVLRLSVGDRVELFDRAGRAGQGIITRLEPRLAVQIEQVEATSPAAGLIVASAVPKGDRADWLVEKLSEVGAARWIPLRTARSVVHPEGVSKFDRWRRIAEESAKQCRRTGVMEIGELVALPRLLTGIDPGIDARSALLLSTAASTAPIGSRLQPAPSALVVGPEGGWTEDEEQEMLRAGLTPVTLGPTILRIETAAVVGAGIVAACSSRS